MRLLGENFGARLRREALEGAPYLVMLYICAFGSHRQILSAVVPAGFFHRERFGVAIDMRIGDFADDDAVIAEFVEADYLALDRCGRVGDYRRTVRAVLKREVAELAVFGFDVAEECSGDRLLSRAEHRER